MPALALTASVSLFVKWEEGVLGLVMDRAPRWPQAMTMPNGYQHWPGPGLTSICLPPRRWQRGRPRGGHM